MNRCDTCGNGRSDLWLRLFFGFNLCNHCFQRQILPKKYLYIKDMDIAYKFDERGAICERRTRKQYEKVLK